MSSPFCPDEPEAQDDWGDDKKATSGFEPLSGASTLPVGDLSEAVELLRALIVERRSQGA